MIKKYNEIFKKREEIQKRYDEDIEKMENEMKKYIIEIYQSIIDEVEKCGYTASPLGGARASIEFRHQDFKKNFAIYENDYIPSMYFHDEKIDSIMEKAGFSKVG